METISFCSKEAFGIQKDAGLRKKVTIEPLKRKKKGTEVPILAFCLFQRESQGRQHRRGNRNTALRIS